MASAASLPSPCRRCLWPPDHSGPAWPSGSGRSGSHSWRAGQEARELTATCLYHECSGLQAGHHCPHSPLGNYQPPGKTWRPGVHQVPHLLLRRAALHAPLLFLLAQRVYSTCRKNLFFRATFVLTYLSVAVRSITLDRFGQASISWETPQDRWKPGPNGTLKQMILVCGIWEPMLEAVSQPSGILFFFPGI